MISSTTVGGQRSSSSLNNVDRTSQGDQSDVESFHQQQHQEQAASAQAATRQKRRRVTRACDECRRKKIKCDGRQPCTHCTVYSYECTYDQPSHRRRNPTPQYMETIERRLHRAEALLGKFMPNVNLDDESLDNLTQTNRSAVQAQPNPVTAHASVASDMSQLVQSNSGDPTLASMVKATGQLDIDDRGHWDYHGHSSGLSFLRQTKEHFGDIVGPELAGSSRPNESRRKDSQDALNSSNSSVRTLLDSPIEGSRVFRTDDLPSKEVALELCSHALDDATCILMIVHQPSFYKSVDRIYERTTDQYENEDHQFLPLLYVVLALGCLFARQEESDLERQGYANATEEGYKYFWAGRQLIDVTDCRDLASLQAIVFMTLFLQCSAKLSTCYSYIGVALRSALRMGLHRSFRDNFNPIEAEVRKRVFWVVRNMDTYVGAMLGLPQTLSEDDIDQDYPTEVDDKSITMKGIERVPQGPPPLIAATNAHFSLTKIVAKIVRSVYPIKGFQHNEESTTGAYSISYATVRELEDDLQLWLDKLPPLFRPESDAPAHMVRIQQLLRIAYAHAQMLLYRPFLHYVSSDNPAKPGDPRSYACAAACVSVSRNIIHITAEMQRRSLLNGSYWFAMYTTFFAILSLVYYSLESPANAGNQDIIRNAKEGKETLSQLAKRSMAADRCTSTLTMLFDRLPEALREGSHSGGDQVPTRKRNATSPLPPAASHQENITQRPLPKPCKRSTAPRSRPNMRLNLDGIPSFQHYMPPHFQHPAQQHAEATLHLQSNHHAPQDLHPPNLPPSINSFSAIMFPSGDPFAYPLQPMAALEHTHSIMHNQDNSFYTSSTSSPSMHHHGHHHYNPVGQQQTNYQNPYAQPLGHDLFLPASTTAQGTVSADDHLDVQFLGSLTPFLMAGGGGGMGTSSAEGQSGHGYGHAGQQSDIEMWAEQVQPVKMRRGGGGGGGGGRVGDAMDQDGDGDANAEDADGDADVDGDDLTFETEWRRSIVEGV